QQREVDAGRAGEHGVHQPLVAGHVHEADAIAVGAVHEGIAELDADAALLLLGQAIGVHAGEGPDERGLAVVDMTCGSDDHGCGWASPMSGSTSVAGSAGPPARAACSAGNWPTKRACSAAS